MPKMTLDYPTGNNIMQKFFLQSNKQNNAFIASKNAFPDRHRLDTAGNSGMLDGN